MVLGSISRVFRSSGGPTGRSQSASPAPLRLRSLARPFDGATLLPAPDLAILRDLNPTWETRVRATSDARHRVASAPDPLAGGVAQARTGAAQAGSPLEPRRVDRPDRSTRPGQHARRAGRDARGRARGDPARADGRVAVRVLPRRGRRDGVGSRDDADDGHPGAGVRRRAPPELRHVRRTGPPAGVRRQRLRRDAPRVLRVGREAAGRECRRRRARPRVRGARRPQGGAHGRLGVPGADVALRGEGVPGRLVLADRHRHRQRAVRRRPVPRRGPPAPPCDRAGSPAYESRGAREALRAGGRRLPDPLGATADRPRARAAPRRRGGRVARRDRGVRADPLGRAARGRRPPPLRRLRAQGRRRRHRSAPTRSCCS